MDRPTRGRTRPRRLRALDAFVLRRAMDVLERWRGPFVDLGFGEEPTTTLESAAAFRAVVPELRVVGLELDPARVSAAAEQQDALTRFQLGGFEALEMLGPARIVRVMNVLRGYREGEVPEAHERITASLDEGGLGLEGSADPTGGLLTAHLLRRRAGRCHREGLLFFTACEHGFAPMQFRDWLPRDLRRRVLPGEAIHQFLQSWSRAWERTRGEATTPREAFSASVGELVSSVEGVDPDPWLREQGYLLWRPAGGVPATSSASP